MSNEIRIGHRLVGENHPVYIVAEIGINHNGDFDVAKQLIDVSVHSGCDAVKFQKRTPELCVPPEERNVMRETPWGIMSYIKYRHKIEFGFKEYREIDHYCKERKVTWFASCWDEPSVDFIEQFDPPCYKIPSPALTDAMLLRHLLGTGRPLILSTGMSTMQEIQSAVHMLGTDNLLITHCTSAYPCQPHELNLRVIETLRREFDCPIGYSGHEVGLPTTVSAVALGACLIERHVTLDRAMWGSDQAASIEPQGLDRLVKYIRVLEQAMGNGAKEVYASELPIMRRLRGEDRLSIRKGRTKVKSGRS